MIRVPTRTIVACLVATLLFEAGAAAPAFVLAGETAPSDGSGLGWFDPALRNSLPLAIEQPVAPVHIEGVPGGVVPGLGAAIRPDFVPYDPPSVPEEVVALRSEFGTVTANPDGTFTAEYNAGRINFMDAAGSFHPIDLTLVSDGDATYGLHTAANSFAMRVNAHGGGRELAELQLGDRVVRLRQLTPVAGPPALAEGAAHFPAPQGDGAVSIIPTPEGLEFTVTLDDATRPGTYHFVLDTGGLRAEPGPDGHGVQLLDASGAVVATVSPPSVFDALELHAPLGTVSASVADSQGPVDVPSATPAATSIPSDTPTVAPASASASPAASATTPAATDVPAASPSATPTASPSATTQPTASPTAQPTPPVEAGLGPNEVLLSYTIDPAWLHDPSRAFPVTLDPTICIQKGQTVAPSGCNELSDPAGYIDTFVMSGLPGSYPIGWDEMRVGWDTTSYGYQKQRGFFYFPNVVDELWDDGFELVNASLVLKQTQNFDTANGQQIRFELVTKGWSTTSTWNSQPTTSATEVTPYTGVLSQAQVPDFIPFDVTKLVRHWYTHNLADWMPNLGLMVRMEDEINDGNGIDKMVHFRNRLAAINNRPRLALTYVVPKVNIAFDTATLGPDFAPSTMPAGTTVALPVKVTNNGSGFSFPASGSDYYALGYRWFDATGAVVATSGLTSLPAALANNATSGVITLPVAAPASVGQYTLRLDLVHMVGADKLWASDWALPTLYYSGAKSSSDPANTRIVGSSVIQQAEFGVAVVGGGGTAMGETQTVGLADGSSLGINLWSRNLRFDGAGGPGFADLGGDFGLSYFYDSANRTDCSGILKACGWGTNFDEGFRPGVTGSDYVYVDAAGNRYLVGATGTGQLVSSAGVRLERVRHTILDENWMSVTWGTAWSGTGNDPTISTTYSYNSSGHSYKVGEGNAGTATSSFTPVDLDSYPLVSFAVKGASAASAAIGFEIVNQSKGTTAWLAYTIGTDFSMSGVSKIALGGSISSWRAIDLRDVRADAVTKGLGTATERFSVKSVKLWGGTGSGGSVYFDSVRFQGRETTLFDNTEPSWTANGGQAAPYAADYVTAGYSMQVLPQTEANSPNCVDCVSQSLTTHPFATWSWRKVGGSLMAIAFHVKDVRSNATGTITYYAGPKPNPEPAGWIQISDTAPTAWTTVMRNLLDDAREKLGFFDNYGATFDSEDETQIGPQPDPVDLTGFRLIGGSSSTDGNFALFDLAQIHSLTNLGDDYSAVQGDDFVVTLPGRERHFFNRDGVLRQIQDSDGNATVLDWTYNFTAYTITLASVHAPSDGMSISGGTATRRLDVTYNGSTSVKVQEILNGVTGRYAEFARDVSNNLTSVVPARRSSACAGSGASGCLKFAYDTGSLLNRVTDPRDTGTPYPLSATITWVSGSPTKITSAATSTDLLRINDWGDPTAVQWRVRWQDANGIAASGNGYTRPVDLTPNGSVLVVWRPIICTHSACGSYGASGTLADKLVEYQADGIDNYSSETYYRLAGNGGAVTSRRGSFAAAAVDNLVDPLTAQLTPWTQSAAQYAASTDQNHELYRTTYVYDADGSPIRISTPFTNPASSTAVSQTLLNRYDSETHLLESSDNAFLVNGGFESGLDGWTNSGATWEQTNVNSGLGSLKVTGTNSANQTAQLLPGQTFRFQLARKTGSGSGATYQVDYQRASDSSWQQLLAPTTDPSTAWNSDPAYDITIPADGNGKVKVTLKIGSGSGTVYFDDVVVMTTFAGASYQANGLPAARVDVLDRTTLFGYTATTAHPAIFNTQTTQAYDTSHGATPEWNVVSTQTYNAWGLPLVSTDPDGVTSTTTYASNKTDVATIADGLGNTTSFTSYDAIGQLLTMQDPLSRTATTTYNWFGSPVDQNDYAGIVTHAVYDAVGRPTSVYANWVNGGSGTSGVNNVKTTFTYDEFGRVTRQVGDSGTGLSNATTDTGYDLLGNVVSLTVYPTGTSNGRTVTTYYGAAGLAVGTSGPIVPSAGSAPTCPGTSVKCNAITSVDLNGRASLATDAYGVQTLTWYDFAGKAVRQVANYVSGGGATSSQNVVTSSRYDAADRLVSVTDPLGNVTSTTYDNLDRITKITRADTSWVETVYKASGRIDMESRPTANSNDLVWTKHIYDAAGRQTKTIDHYDNTTGQARLWLTPFEAGADGWSASGTGWFTGSGASASSSTADGFSGARGLAVTTGTSNYTGVYVNLSGSTFKSSHSYRVRARVKTTSGTTLQAFMGVDASGGDYGASSSLTTDGTWQVLDLTWTPAADRSANVHLAIRRLGTSNVTFYIDDVIIWDTSTAAGNTPDWNIPTETVYDAAGRITATVMVPGDPATDGAFVTLTSYTARDQIASVRAAATPAYPATSGVADLDLLTNYAYDALGNQTDVTDPTGVITHYDYDRRGNITGSTANYVAGQPATTSQNVKATFAYDNLGELLASCAPKHVQAGCNPATPSSTAWRYSYDALGHVLTATPPANTTGTALMATTYVHDTASGGARLTRTCDHPVGGSCSNASRYVDSEYDALGRVTESTTFTGSPTGAEALRTEVTYNAGSQQTGVTYFESGTQKDALTFTYDSLGRQTVVTRGGNAITTAVYDPLSNVTSRTDHAISSTASTFTFDWRGNELTASSSTYSGSTTFAWRFDGLVATRTWPTGTNAATFAYDRAKRPTTLTEKVSGVDQAGFTQTYNRAGSVTAEGRTLSGISGIAGTGSQSFSYDPLHRVTGSSISGGPTQTYDYDANSNRTSWNDGTATTNYDYNESDELTAQHRSGVDSNYAYDAYGNITSSAVTTAGATSYTYDAQDRLLSITPPSGGALSFTLDALGRRWTKSIGGTLSETYGYIGASESVVRIDLASSSISAAIDAAGNRAATSTSGGGFGWLLPDLHGNVAGTFTASGSAISDAFRYSAYGTTLAKTNSSLPSPWRYQGRFALNSDDGSGANTDLYDFVFRAYDPALGAFTSLDTVAGGVQDPLTLNRFVYALANPATLIDPDGHMAVVGESGSYNTFWGTPGSARKYLWRHMSASEKKAELATRDGLSAMHQGWQLGQLREHQELQEAKRDRLRQTSALAAPTLIDVYSQDIVSRTERLRLNRQAGANWENVTRAQLQEQYGTNYEIVQNRAILGPDRRPVQINGSTVRPDFQIINKATRRLVAVVEAKTGSITYLRTAGNRAIQTYYRVLAKAGLGDVPVTASYRIRSPRPSVETISRGANLLAFGLMLVDTWAAEEAEHRWEAELEWYAKNDPVWYDEIMLQAFPNGGYCTGNGQTIGGLCA